RRVPASVPARCRARSLSAPDSSGGRDAPAPSAGASRNGAACTRISRSYPVPAGGSSADLGVGACCREPRSENVAADALAHAAVCLLGTDADEGVVVLATASLVAAARDARKILVVQTAQGLLRQLELPWLVHHRPPSHVGTEPFQIPRPF